MTDRNTLLALADRCEATMGADRMLDREIQIATVGWPAAAETGEPTPAYTASLDAAMTLVPRGMVMLLTNTGIDLKVADLTRGSAMVGFPDCIDSSPLSAATPALALCAAALRARVAMMGEG